MASNRIAADFHISLDKARDATKRAVESVSTLEEYLRALNERHEARVRALRARKWGRPMRGEPAEEREAKRQLARFGLALAGILEFGDPPDRRGA